MNTSTTQSFYFLTWTAFMIALLGTVLGVLRLEADIQTKGFFLMSYLFSIFATFTLSKVVRDRQEEKK